VSSTLEELAAERARMNLVTAALILAATIAGGTWEYVLWGLAVSTFVITPWLVPEEAGWIQPSHFVERHGLVVMVALGESVVAVGIGASGIAITGEMLAVAVLGLIVSAELWWVYFGGDDVEAEGAIRRMTPTRREFYESTWRTTGPTCCSCSGSSATPPLSSGRSATPSTLWTSPGRSRSVAGRRSSSRATPSSVAHSSSRSGRGERSRP
jgi:hypothetical protein